MIMFLVFEDNCYRVNTHNWK